MSHKRWVIQIPAWMFTWRIFWAFRRFWIDLLGIEPARWLLEVPSGWKQVKWDHFRSFDIDLISKSLTVVTHLTFSSLFKSGFFPLFHPTGKFKIIEFDWSISWGISGLFFSAFWSSDNGVTKSGTTCASVCFFECSISISEPNLISWALFGIHEPVQSYLDQNKFTLGPVWTIPYYKWVSSVWRINTK